MVVVLGMCLVVLSEWTGAPCLPSTKKFLRIIGGVASRRASHFKQGSRVGDLGWDARWGLMPRSQWFFSLDGSWSKAKKRANHPPNGIDPPTPASQPPSNKQSASPQASAILLPTEQAPTREGDVSGISGVVASCYPPLCDSASPPRFAGVEGKQASKRSGADQDGHHSRRPRAGQGRADGWRGRGLDTRGMSNAGRLGSQPPPPPTHLGGCSSRFGSQILQQQCTHCTPPPPSIIQQFPCWHQVGITPALATPCWFRPVTCLPHAREASACLPLI